MSTKSGTPLLFTGVSHNFAPLCDIHRRRPNVVPVVGLEPTRRISPTDFEFYRLLGNEWTVIPYGGP